MRRLFVSFVFVVVAALLALAPVSFAGDAATHYYVSLGDSLSVGVQPIGPPPFFETDQGYTDRLSAALSANDPKLKHISLGCGGESTTSMRFGSQPEDGASSCGPPVVYLHLYPHKTQLAEAVSFLHAHHDKVSLVTIDIGANDAFSTGVAPIAVNLPVILAELREAAGPDVPIVGMNYYDPFLPQAWAVGGMPGLLGEIAAVTAFNNLLEGIYGAAGSPVADVESAFSVTNTTLVGGTPLDVVRACQWTWFCAPPPLGPNIHANATGYGVMAQAFLAALPT
jgi:lysophospholipase L1-like esterase